MLLKFKKTENTTHLFNDKKNYLFATTTQNYKGNAKSNKKVILLVSHNTGSAADKFTSVIKDNKLGLIIGNNTGGEGLMGSFIANSLPNSKLVFIYMPGKALTADGTDNSSYGTSPDIYISQSYESFYKLQQLQKNNKNPYIFENQLLWDEVLIKAIDIIKNN